MKNTKSWGRKVINKGGEIVARLGGGVCKATAVAGAVVLGLGAVTQPVHAALVTTTLTDAIEDNITVVEGLAGSGFALLALFIAIKVIRRGANRAI